MVSAAQAETLASLGRFMTSMIDENPNEMFLIEGHTDAVGSAASNLALSDRRAESVALALTEYFDVPPENMVVQGYGEGDLRLATDSDGDSVIIDAGASVTIENDDLAALATARSSRRAARRAHSRCNRPRNIVPAPKRTLLLFVLPAFCACRISHVTGPKYLVVTI